VTVDIGLKDGKLADLGLDVKACALGQAASAVTSQSAIGTSLETVRLGRDQLKAMLKGKGGVPDAPFDGFEVLTPAVEYKNRHASILLSIEALVEAMAAASETA
jgi:NifU-like protein involved in Fe-S cluster formation